ncbi:TMhelix containing protein [Vibrio phage 1.285.O._10N.286.55.C12]|nr:TMhelix containing protein [Vibrio phage 1.088.O._10N.261.46.A1]AUS01451.1 TMhelix containing protein [Vibrio phage 1.285.O._10N.286.55.C12]
MIDELKEIERDMKLAAVLSAISVVSSLLGLALIMGFGK